MNEEISGRRASPRRKVAEAGDEEQDDENEEWTRLRRGKFNLACALFPLH